MDRAVEFETVLDKKRLKDNRKIHKKNLRGATAVIDNKEPQCYKYPLVKSKKEMLIEGKCLRL